jgi:hypothetical protein
VLGDGCIHRLNLHRYYGGRGVNGYMLDCESGVAGSIPVDHPMGTWRNWSYAQDLKSCGFIPCRFKSDRAHQFMRI